MSTIKEFYYKKEDALKAAYDFQRLWGGWMGETYADARSQFSYEDMQARQLCWSGEINAVQVYGCKYGMAGLFAWWEE